MFARILSIIGLLATVALGLILNMSEPSSAGPLVILLVFILMYAITLVLTTFLIYYVSLLVIRITHRNYVSLTMRRAYYFATIIALAPVILIGLQSIGGLEVHEVVLVIVFTGLGLLYVARRSV